MTAPDQPGSPPHVTILMALYNGAPEVDAQLQSIAEQTHPDWSLVVSDDGSKDDSPELVRAFARQQESAGRMVHFVQGPGRGAAANFLSMIATLPEKCGWVALSDQDDKWLPERLEAGLSTLGDDTTPALFCSRTWIADQSLEPLRLSPPRPRPLSFRNALVQNVAAGNTILLNPAAAALAREQAVRLVEARLVPVVHDWWLYQLITGVGGRIVHHDEPTLLYRQHGGNEIGANDSFAARNRRIGMVLSGVFAEWHRTNVATLRQSSDVLTEEARELLEGFAELPDLSPRQRVQRLRALGLYRQTRAGNTALWLAAVAGRL